MKTLYHGNRHKTTEMVQEEVYALGSQIRILGEYSRAKDPIECACEVCDYTWVGTVNSLLNGQGCNKCARRINPTLEELQKELDSLGKRFIVSGDFLKSTDKLMVTCLDCGFEWTAVSNSLRRNSYSCARCRKASIIPKTKAVREVKATTLVVVKEEIQKKTRAEKAYDRFHEKMSEKGIKFTLISEFVGSKTKIQVFCNDCCTISIKMPCNILLNMCAVCSCKVKGSLFKVQQKLDKDKRDILVSGNYTNAFGKLDCECLVCSTRWTCHPHNLLNGLRGCPSCALTGYDPNKPGYLYYLRVSDDNDIYWKIGITNIGLKGRFRPADRKLIEVLYCHLFDDGFVAQKAERNILDMFSEYRAENVNLLRAGNTELFTKDILQMNHLSSWSI